MSATATFTPEVFEKIQEYVKAHPRNPNTSTPESVWCYGYTKDTPRRFFGLSRMFCAIKGVYYGLNIRATNEPLKFTVSIFEQIKDETVHHLGKTTEHVAILDDVPKVIANAEKQARDLAIALALETGAKIDRAGSRP